MIGFSGNPPHSRALKLAGAAIVAGLAALLAGCPSQSSEQTSTPTAQAVAFHGTLYGGRQPIVSSAITVYAASPTAGAPATPIGSATTDPTGHFSIATFSPVPASGAIIYVTATGGNATGQTPPVLNSAVELATVAGPYCTSEDPACFPPSVNINELTTAAMAYSMAGFTSLTGGIVNVSGGNPGLTNAAKTFASLVDAATGQAVFQDGGACTGSGEPQNCTPLRRLDTLANVAAACVNAQNGAASTQCTHLFSQATPNGGTAPIDTFAALLNIATVPDVRNNTSGIFGLAPAGTIYSPSLGTAPNAWALAIAHDTGIYTFQPTSVAVDSEGNVWMASNGLIQKLDPVGTVLLNQFTGITYPGRIAVDRNDFLYLPASGGTSLLYYNPFGTLIFTDTGGGLDHPQAVAESTDGYIWTASYTNSSLNEFDTHNRAVSPSNGYTGGGLNLPTDIAVDSGNHIWVVSAGVINEFNHLGQPLSPSSGYGAAPLNGPTALAIDPDGHVWVAGYNLVEFASDGTEMNANNSTPPLMRGICIDAAGNVWTTSYTGDKLSEFDSTAQALSPATGYIGGALDGPSGIAVDPSGNLWIANSNQNDIVEYIGMAAPTRTPIILATINGFTP